MKYTDFEKHINAELSGGKEPVQIDALLTALDLNNTKKKRFPIWIILPFLLLIGAAFYFGKFDSTIVETHSSTYSNNELTTTNNKSSNEISRSLKNRKLLANNESITTQQNKTSSTKKNESTISSIQTNSIDNLSNVNAISNDNIFSNREIKLENKTTPTKNTIHYHSHGSLEEFNSIETNEVNPSSSSLINETTPPEYLKFSPANNSNTTNKDQRLKLDISSLVIAKNNLEIASLDLDKDDIFSRMKINCPSFSKAHWRMALIPEIGIHKAFKTIESKLIEEPVAFSIRNSNEASREALNLGVYGMLLRDKMPVFIKAGVSYTRITERMDLDYNYTELDTTIGIISSTVSGNGDTITHIYGPVVSEIQHTGSNVRHHYIHLFDMPISVGYSTYFAGIDIALEGGININLLTKATGNILVGQKEYTNLSFESLFKKRIGVSYFGGLMLGRNFSSLGDFYIAPRFNYYPNDFTNTNNTIRQKYLTVGINAGIIYKIK